MDSQYSSSSSNWFGAEPRYSFNDLTTAVVEQSALFLAMLPVEIRYKIYESLMPGTERTIELSRPRNRAAPLSFHLTPLSLTCKQVNRDVRTWYRGLQSLYAFEHTARFGPLNLSQTKFTMTIHHPTWSKCPCYTRSLLDSSPLPCVSYLPYCPSTTLLSLLTWHIADLFPIPKLSLFLLAEDEPSTAHNDNRHSRLQYNKNAWMVCNDLVGLKEIDIFVGWEMTTQELRAYRQLDWDAPGEVWIPVGGNMYVTREREEGVEVRLWYLVETGKGMRGVAQEWRVWPKEGAPVQIHDPRGYDDLALIDIGNTMLVGPP